MSAEPVIAHNEAITPLPVRKPRYGKPFFPGTIFGSSMYILATAIALFALAILHPADSFYSNHSGVTAASYDVGGATARPEDQPVVPADSLNHSQYNPRPEWYFLFLFQILKYFGGGLEIIGTAVIPGIAAAVLLLLPFYDRNWSRRAIRRPIAVGLGIATLVGLGYLTYEPIRSGAISSPSTALIASPTFAYIESVFSYKCQTCHIAARSGGLNLSSYAGLMAGGNAIPGVNAVIVKGNPSASYLYQVITWHQKVGLSMPLGATVQIDKGYQQNIYSWIKNGALDK